MNGKCYYCNKDGPLRVSAEENPSKQDLYVCEMHWNVLKNPKMAVPFLRGVLAEELRGTASEESLNKRKEAFIEMIRNWKRIADLN
jgi:hypothetical protein